ncbi:hypothetical protein ACFE04_025605 [Oxalis oulophora]
MVDAHAQSLPKANPNPDQINNNINNNNNKRKKGLISIRELIKLIKVLIKRLCYRRKTSSLDDSIDDNFEAIDISQRNCDVQKNNQQDQDLGDKGRGNMYGASTCRHSSVDGLTQQDHPAGLYKQRNFDKCFPSPLSRTTSQTRSKSRRDSHDDQNGSSSETLPRSTSRKGPVPILFSESLSRNASRKSGPIPIVHSGPLSRNASRRGPTPIFFSNSTGTVIKPPAVEGTLECTLEELCFGCKKKIKITRDVITDNGQLIEEDDLLSINVKPGWKKGTKITFEGMGHESLGNQFGDVNIVIAEKKHPLFTREGDDLELAVEIPLVKALTGCTISIPLLGGEKMSLTIDDLVKPGDKKVIPGQGMPYSKEQGKRGDLKVLFLIEFPTELTEEKRREIVSILADAVE